MVVGIGLAILQSLAQCSPKDHFLLACRTRANGEEAVRQLRELGVEAEVDVLELDVTSDESIAKTGEWVGEKFGGLDGQLFLVSRFLASLTLHVNLLSGRHVAISALTLSRMSR